MILSNGIPEETHLQYFTLLPAATSSHRGDRMMIPSNSLDSTFLSQSRKLSNDSVFRTPTLYVVSCPQHGRASSTSICCGNVRCLHQVPGLFETQPELSSERPTEQTIQQMCHLANASLFGHSLDRRLKCTGSCGNDGSCQRLASLGRQPFTMRYLPKLRLCFVELFLLSHHHLG